MGQSALRSLNCIRGGRRYGNRPDDLISQYPDSISVPSTPSEIGSIPPPDFITPRVPPQDEEEEVLEYEEEEQWTAWLKDMRTHLSLRELSLPVALALLAGQLFSFLLVFLLYHWCVTVPDERGLVRHIRQLQALLDERQGSGGGAAPGDLAVAGRALPKINGSEAHHWPKMYGKVPEKTIWTYWYDPELCRSSMECQLPPALDLCMQTVRKNKGSFSYWLLRPDQVTDFVSPYELPALWRELAPELQRDAVMNAILARYGGVALDLTVLLLRPLDDYWDEMVAKGATFYGYVYRLNGFPWKYPESTASWFKMSRREGIFSSAVRSQVTGMGGSKTAVGLYGRPVAALGDQTLLPILSMFNYTLPPCSQDPSLAGGGAKSCPELQQPSWSLGLSGPARSDMRLLLRDPRDGPQLPFHTIATLWDVHNETVPLPAYTPDPHDLGGPMYMEDCLSMKACWDVFTKRFEEAAPPGEARKLSFVKAFSSGKELPGVTEEEILAAKHTYFYHWLHLSGLARAWDLPT